MSVPPGQTDSGPPSLHFQALWSRVSSLVASKLQSAKQCRSLFNKRSRPEHSKTEIENKLLKTGLRYCVMFLCWSVDWCLSESSKGKFMREAGCLFILFSSTDTPYIWPSAIVVQTHLSSSGASIKSFRRFPLHGKTTIIMHVIHSPLLMIFLTRWHIHFDILHNRLYLHEAHYGVTHTTDDYCITTILSSIHSHSDFQSL